MLPLVVGLVVLLGMAGLCSLVPESRLVLRQWRVLVPFVSGWLVALALAGVGLHLAFVGKALPLPPALMMGGLQLSLLAVLIVVLEVFVAAWVTPLILRVAAGERVADALWSCMAGAPALMPRMFAALFVGYAVPVGGVMLVVEAIRNDMVPMSYALPLVTGVAVIVCPLWSVLTGSLVFEAVDRQQSFRAAVQKALRFGRDHGVHWWRLVVAQAVLAGIVVVLPERFFTHAMWFGGYGATNHWFEDAQNVQPMLLAGLPRAVLFVGTMVLATTIKLRVALARQAVQANAEARSVRPASATRRAGGSTVLERGS